MKRLISTLVLLVVLVSTAIADEILFRDIPWGSNTFHVEKSVRDFAGGYDSTLDDMPTPYWPEDPFDILSAYTSYETGWNVYTYTDELNVAGYPVISVDAFCHYGIKDDVLSRDKNDGEFYQAIYTFDVIDIERVYADLKAKLSQLYGHGEEKVENSSGVRVDSNGDVAHYDTTAKFTTWVGDNSTSAMLCCSTSTLGIEEDPWNNYVTLRYGKTDANIALKRVVSFVKSEHLAEEASGVASNLDGL